MPELLVLTMKPKPEEILTFRVLFTDDAGNDYRRTVTGPDTGSAGRDAFRLGGLLGARVMRIEDVTGEEADGPE
jgi:hypothetical protein